MKKILILILSLALLALPLLSACAPDEPETLYGKPKLSQLSDEELLKVINEFREDESTLFPGDRNADINLVDIRNSIAIMEEHHKEYTFFDSKGSLYPFLFYDYYEIDLFGSESTIE